MNFGPRISQRKAIVLRAVLSVMLADLPIIMLKNQHDFLHSSCFCLESGDFATTYRE